MSGPARTTPSGTRRLLARGGLVLAAWAILAALLVGAGDAVTHSGAVQSFDRHVTSVVVAHRTATLTSAMRAFTWLGSWVALVVCLCLLVVLAVRRRVHPLVVAVVLVAWAGEAAGVAVAKAVVGRARPPERIWETVAQGSSWPSGHTAVAVLIFGTLAIAATVIVHSRAVRALTWTLAALLVLVTAYSRVELGVHWCTDTLASLLFVTAWLSVVARASRRALPAPYRPGAPPADRPQRTVS